MIYQQVCLFKGNYFQYVLIIKKKNIHVNFQISISNYNLNNSYYFDDNGIKYFILNNTTGEINIFGQISRHIAGRMSQRG